MPRASALSFRARLTLRWTVVFSCVLAIASAVIFLGLRSTSYAELDGQLLTLAGTEVASAVDGPGPTPHIHDMPAPALPDGTFTEKLVQVFDEHGRLTLASAGRAQRISLLTPSQIQAGLAGQVPFSTVDAEGLPVRVVALRTVATGRPYAIAVGVVISGVVSSLHRVGGLLILVWLVSSVATATVGFTLASTALRPVTAITKRAMDIAASDLRARLEPPAVKDEIGEMTLSLNALLERLQGALDANRRFAADAAHELRTPVTAIAGEIEVALRRERTAAEYKETLALVGQSVSELSALIGDLMLLARAQESGRSVDREALSIDWVVKSSIEKLAPMAESRGVVVGVGKLADVYVDGDARMLSRVFDNVLENAIRYNRHGGRVDVSVSAAEPDLTRGTPGVVTVRVTDDGHGIPEEDHERIFDRFYRVDASRSPHTGGAGLGLAIAREVLAMFKGTIRVERSSSLGTTIAIQLPGRRVATAG
jgi:two-component system, OmpR family, sensor kinase